MTLMEPIKPATTAGITCIVTDLRRAVNAAAFVVERRNTIPVLGCLRIEPLNDKLRIEGTNLDSWIMVDCPATCTEGDAFVIDARLLLALLNGAERDDSVSITLDGNILTLRIGPAVARVQLLCPASDWPTLPGTKGMSWVSIPEAVLSKLFGRVRWAISTEETRYYLNGIYMHGRDGRLAGAATDGHRLALYQADADWPLPNLIFPRYSVAARCAQDDAIRALRDRGTDTRAFAQTGRGFSRGRKAHAGGPAHRTVQPPASSRMGGIRKRDR